MTGGAWWGGHPEAFFAASQVGPRKNFWSKNPIPLTGGY